MRKVFCSGIVSNWLVWYDDFAMLLSESSVSAMGTGIFLY